MHGSVSADALQRKEAEESACGKVHDPAFKITEILGLILEMSMHNFVEIFLVRNVRERNVQVQKIRGETSRSKKSGSETCWSKMSGYETSRFKKSGAKRPGPKCLGLKRPGPKFS